MRRARARGHFRYPVRRLVDVTNTLSQPARRVAGLVTLVTRFNGAVSISIAVMKDLAADVSRRAR